MPAKKTPAPKAPAKPATKAPAKPAAKAPAKVAKPASKSPAKPVTKAANPAPKKSPPVKKEKAPAKSAAPKPAAKKAAAPKPAANAAPAKKAAVKEAPAKKEKAAAAPAPAAKKEKASAPAPAKEAPAPAATKKAAPAPKEEKVAAPAKPKASASTPKITNVRRTGRAEDEGITMDTPPKKPVLPAAFLKKQRQRLVELRDAYLNSAEGVTNSSLRGSEGDSSAFGMHQADAGSDAYDRDFALSLLAKEQDAIYEINEALKRIDLGMYGICEMSGETIPEERLEALPFTRFTVGCQERIEREQRSGRWNRPVRSLFGLDEASDDGDDDRDEEDSGSSSSNNNESLDFSKE
ncbi:transcriptional regulator, TraR/DksA family [Prosthecobacter debontii]|uniref:Transcriptional regulator, TraR/DksA family n=1 Tax=Prosthecobacter debontii TaxID=48467 RepID=A0A1T4X8C9_9BACT|nr:TraR/DksA C4-type zinc finger protein [Prosthecobacter debontii]SKA85852.1 transcriptional regulator, TraR/DksA family [Prosthecobacter debontii]